MPPIFSGKWFLNPNITQSGTDPYWLQVIGLFSFDGDYSDKSLSNATFQRNAGGIAIPTISTSTFKYGTGALSTNGGLSWWSITAPGTSSFTFESWVNPTFSTSASDASIFDIWQTGAGSVFSLRRNVASTPAQLGIYGSLGTTILAPSASTEIQDGVWSHVAVVRNVNLFTLFINGVEVGNGSNSYSINGTLPHLGRDAGGGKTLYALYDEARLTTAVRYSSNFTPPTAAFPSR